MAVAGSLFDGRTAIQQAVLVVPVANGWRLIFADGGGEEVIEAAHLHLVDKASERVRFAHAEREGWRLSLPAPLDPALAAALGHRPRHPIGRPSPLVGGIAIVGGLMIAAVIALLVVPERLARHLPLSVERRLGEGLGVPLAAARCGKGDGPAALARLVDRIDPAARGDGISVDVFDVGAVNAVTLPGGRIGLFRGLLDATPDSDAVAGILAHEIAHARRRHVAAALIRQLGFGVIVTMIGGNLAGQANTLVNLRFSRGAEAEADADALAALLRAGISPRPTAKALGAFEAREGGLPGWLSDHPASAGRAAKFDAAFRQNVAYRPVLSPAQSAALHGICNG